MKKRLIVLICTVFSGVVFAQQDLQLSQYMLNNTYFNPGATGLENYIKASALYRTQWTGYSGSPQSQLLHAEMPLNILRGGIGIVLSNDNRGPYTDRQLMLAYSYHLNFGSYKLGLGFRSGLLYKNNNGTYNPLWDMNDTKVNEISNQSLNTFTPDYSLGAFLSHSKFYVGLSSNHIAELKFDNLNSQLKRHYFATAGYFYQLNEKIVIAPSMLYKSDGIMYSTDWTLRGIFNKKYWAGLAYRQEESFSALLGLYLLSDNSLSLGYAFDYVYANQSALAATSHEIMLSYVLPPFIPKDKPAIRSPRYRF